LRQFRRRFDCWGCWVDIIWHVCILYIYIWPPPLLYSRGCGGPSVYLYICMPVHLINT
jgi:hypothetical protein